jgi:hypothetical protein
MSNEETENYDLVFIIPGSYSQGLRFTSWSSNGEVFLGFHQCIQQNFQALSNYKFCKNIQCKEMQWKYSQPKI